MARKRRRMNAGMTIYIILCMMLFYSCAAIRKLVSAEDKWQSVLIYIMVCFSIFQIMDVVVLGVITRRVLKKIRLFFQEEEFTEQI